MNKACRISWMKLSAKTISPQQWNEIYHNNSFANVNYYSCEKNIPAHFSKSLSIVINPHSILFFLWEESTEVIMGIKNKVYTPAKYIVSSNTMSEQKEEKYNPNYLNQLKGKFTKLTGSSFSSNFGYETNHEFKPYIPKGMLWARSSLNDYKHCYKADIRSAWPYEYSKPLPTLHKRKDVDGYAEPNNDYPFAFYTLTNKRYSIKSILPCDGWTTTAFEPNEVEHTILLGVAKHTLRSTVDYFYKNKKEAKDAETRQLYKNILNISQGMMQSTKAKNTFSYIPAVMIARCNCRMSKIVKQLEDEGNIPLMVKTDCVIWQGQPSNIANYGVELGDFAYENNGHELWVCIKSTNIYQTFDTITKEIDTKWSGRIAKDFKNSLKFGEIWTRTVEHKEYIFNKQTYVYDDTIIYD